MNLPHSHRQGAGLALVVSLIAFAPQAHSAAQPLPDVHRPNIILIVADDLGYGDLGCYGQKLIRTPNLDQLAGDGVRLTSFYGGAPVSPASRCALMTGFHSGHGTIRSEGDFSLRSADLTLAQWLKGPSYHTCLLGEWGLGGVGTAGVPEKKGFDDVAGLLEANPPQPYYPDHIWRYEGRSGRETNAPIYENFDGKKGLYLPDLLTSAAMNFSRQNTPDRFNNFRPFFLYWALTIPRANATALGRAGNGMEVPTDGPYTGESWPQAEKNKAAMITRLDTEIGSLLAQLKALRIADNTAIFFTSANGPHKEGGVNPGFFRSAGPFRGLKRDLYEGGIRVPFIACWPGRIPAGRTISEPWAIWDILPTLLDVAEVKAPSDIDGISLLPTLLGRAQTNQHAYLYWETHGSQFRQAARSGKWKAIRPSRLAPLELYDLEGDFGEQHNLAAENPKVVAKFEEYFKTARTDSPLFPLKDEVGPTVPPAKAPAADK